MGKYATTTSFDHLLPQFYKDDNTFDIRMENMIDKSISRAEATVDRYLSGRYSLPFSPVPPDVRRMSEDMACYYLLRASQYRIGNSVNPYLAEFKGVFDELKEIRDGKQDLAYTDGSAVPANVEGLFKSSTKDYTPVFQLDDQEAWKLDDDLVDDLKDSRL